ncbi:MAG: DegT/DnrJ/EryC1/StrS family aminotransferase [Eubacterium sp.]|nr:DegT/DnrJ/EryC1/StrS family aminotransferase [Eubacterium sp.]
MLDGSKKLYVARPSLPSMEEFVEEIKDMWDTGIMTHQGPKHNRLQAELEKFMQVSHVTLFANGHLALELGLESWQLSGEVITTPFTFGSTTQAILRNGLTPVYCDINEDDYTIDCNKLESLITEKTCAIVPVHVYGNICDVERICEIAKRYRLKVVYDGAHAFGETYKGKNIAQYGDMTMFSFHATKVLNTVEGGCVAYSDGSKTQFLEGLRQFGQIVHTDLVPYIGTNAKMTDMHAAMGLCNLRHFDEYIAKRKAVAERYRDRLDGIDGLKLNVIQSDVESNFAYFPIVIEERNSGVTCDLVMEELAKHNVFVRKYFYPLCSDFECIKEMGIHADVPVASYISKRVLTLPCYSDLALEDVDDICRIIRSLYDK